MITILGIDPGSRITGYGVIASDGVRHRYIVSGCIATTTQEFGVRLREIFLGVSKIIEMYQPQEVAIEQVFVDKNPLGALKLGQARGVAMVAATCRDLPLAEYSSRRVKQAVVGYGNADKLQVQHMVLRLLNIVGQPKLDASDALAIAICHSHSRRQLGLGASLK